MQFCSASMSVMLAITNHGVCVGMIASCLVNFIIADIEAVQNYISASRAVLLNRGAHAPLGVNSRYYGVKC